MRPHHQPPALSEEEQEQAAAVAALLDSLTWTPGQCGYCSPPVGEEAEQPTVPVADGAQAGLQGMSCRRHLGLALAMNGHRESRVAKADVLNAKVDAVRRKRAERAAK